MIHYLWVYRPLYVRAPEWNTYLEWPADKVIVTTRIALLENNIAVLAKA